MLENNNSPIGVAIEEVKKSIATSIAKAISEGELTGECPDFIVEIPSDNSHGDFATNVAMAGAKTFRKSPKIIAEIIMKHLDLTNTPFKNVEIAGPGFINFFVSDAWFSSVVALVLERGDSYGRTNYGENKKVMVEFVSANPTGPMHMGNARGGAIGDSLAATLDWAGFDVTKEFYINDAGNQIEKFAISLEARYLQHYKGEENVLFPEDGYHGADITARAGEYIEINGDCLLNVEERVRRDSLVDFALPKNIEKMKTDLGRYRIEFDNWFCESTLHEGGAVARIMETLKEKNKTYEQDGAIWYKATEYGAEKDEVLIRANGNPTYFAADIAYHYNKFVDREFVKCINVWGADHHGHVARLKGAMDAIEVGGDKLDIVLMQLVRLTRGGEAVRMSKRTGKSVALSDLLDEVPIDAARFFFNMREPGSSLDFDLDLAVEQSSQNPVYYVQYANARICSILKNIKAEGTSLRAVTLDELLLLSDPTERALISAIALFPEEIINAARLYDPAKLTHFAVELATKFHKFYSTCHCKVPEEALMQSRLSLCVATRQVLKNILTMLKITTPETM